MNNWQGLKAALRREIDSAFENSGEVVSLSGEVDGDIKRLWIRSGDKQIKLEYDCDKNAVRWEKTSEYGYDRVSEPVQRLAATLLRRLRS